MKPQGGHCAHLFYRLAPLGASKSPMRFGTVKGAFAYALLVNIKNRYIVDWSNVDKWKKRGAIYDEFSGLR